MQKQHTTGFTLVELIVVIVIIVILVAILLPVFSGIARSNNQHTCANNLQNIGVLLAQYRQDNGVYPAAPLSAYLCTTNPASLPFSDAANQFSPTVFTGKNAMNDCAVSGNYSGASAVSYVVKIDNVSGPADTFSWSANGGTPTSGVPITANQTTPQALSNGISLTFTNAIGHQVGDTWSFTAAPGALTPTLFTTRNDCTPGIAPGGTYAGAASAQYVVQIDSVGSPDTFEWSANGGSTWTTTGVPITASPTTPQPLGNTGVTVTFAHTTSHQPGDAWSFTANSTFISPVLFNGRNDCTPSGVYRGHTLTSYKVQIDSVSGPADTYRWSLDNGVTWRGNGIALTANPLKPQFLSNGVQVTFAHSTGHQVGDTWTFSVTPPIVTPAEALPPGQVPMPIPLASRQNDPLHAAYAGATAVNVAITTGLAPGMNVLLHDYNPDSVISDAVTITAITGNTVSFTPALVNEYDVDPDVQTSYVGSRPYYVYIPPAVSPNPPAPVTPTTPGGTVHENVYGVLESRVGNFGLATLYYQDPYTHPGAEQQTLLTSNASIERTFSPSSFHCPQLTNTANISLDANLKPAASSSGLGTVRRVDPLWAGVNTYDITYNYDQYDTDIRNFDLALGYFSANVLTQSAPPTLLPATANSVRQLQNPNAPADTVVCWCYGHRTTPSPSYSLTVPNEPDYTNSPSMSSTENATNLHAFESHRRSDRLLVLWVDGSVNALTPTLAQSATSPNQYYWIPPFLSSPGDWRQ